MYFAGYLLNNGNATGLTFLQKKAVGIMFNEKIKCVKSSKGMLVMSL